MLADQPLMGASREELRPGLRCLPYRKYLIFYRLEVEQIAIVRVVHGSMDLSEQSFSD